MKPSGKTQVSIFRRYRTRKGSTAWLPEKSAVDLLMAFSSPLTHLSLSVDSEVDMPSGVARSQNSGEAALDGCDGLRPLD
jgi:hypothetical protein